jgi:hypothetical protein
MTQNKKVVITGIGIASTMGIGNEEFVHATKKGVSIVDDAQLNTIASEYFGANIIRRMDALSKYGILAAKFAYDDAGLDAIKNQEIGGIFSTVWGPFNRTYQYYSNVLKNGASGVSPLLFPSTVTNAVVGRIAKQLNLRGVSSMLVGTCPINYALNLIYDGKATIVLAGGMDDMKEHLNNHPLMLEDNSTNSIEGSFVLVLEEKESALKRGAYIYAEVENAGIGNVFLQNFHERESLNRDIVKKIIHDSIQDVDPGLPFTVASMQEIMEDINMREIEHEKYPLMNRLFNYRNDTISNKFIVPFGAVSVVNTIISCFILQSKNAVLKEIAAYPEDVPHPNVLVNSYFYSGCVSSLSLSKVSHQ